MGCAPAAPSTASDASKVAVPLVSAPLADYVASPTLRWLVLSRPRELARNPAFAKAIARWIDDEHWGAFRTMSGLDLREIEHGLVAGYDYGTLYLAATAPGEARVAEDHFRRRLLRGETVRRPHPDLFEVTGVVGETPSTFVRVAERFVGVSVGDPTPARITEGYALGRIRKTPSALEGAALAPLALVGSNAPFRVLVPGPFDNERAAANGEAGGLLSASTAAALTILPVDGAVRLRVALAGTWKDDPHAADRMRAAWGRFATSTTGHLLGLDAPRVAPTVEVSPAPDPPRHARSTAKPERPPNEELHTDRLELTVVLELETLLTGVYALTKASLDEIFEVAPDTPRAAERPDAIPEAAPEAAPAREAPARGAPQSSSHGEPLAGP